MTKDLVSYYDIIFEIYDPLLHMWFHDRYDRVDSMNFDILRKDYIQNLNYEIFDYHSYMAYIPYDKNGNRID